MAIDGEQADPRVPAPAGLRTLLTFTRLSTTTYRRIAAVVDDDDAFRARVAAAAPEEDGSGLGRAGWLWLHRPSGWADDPVWAEAGGDDPAGRPAGVPGASRLKRQQEAAEAKAAKHERAAGDAEAARRKAVEQLADVAQAADEAAAERDLLRKRIDVLEVERNRAVRSAKALEADLGQTRRDLKAAREATRQAEAELLAVRDGAGPGADAADPAPRRPRRSAPEPAPSAPATVVEPLDRGALSGAVGSAAAASADLAQAVARAAASSTELAKALAAAAVLLAPAPAGPAEPQALEVGERPRRGVGPGGRRPKRVAPPLPPGTFADTPEAHRHLVTAGEALVVVDGYNVARSAWSGLAPEEERRRTVALLEEVQARSGGPVVVVFDGQDGEVAPVASRSVRVRFSATGVTADTAIAELVADVGPGQPVVVVSSDREVARDGRRLGAVVLSSPEFLAAAGR